MLSYALYCITIISVIASHRTAHLAVMGTISLRGIDPLPIVLASASVESTYQTIYLQHDYDFFITVPSSSCTTDLGASLSYIFFEILHEIR